MTAIVRTVDEAVTDAVVFAGLTACQRCRSAFLRRCTAPGQFAFITCRRCGYVHVRALRHVAKAVRAAVKSAR